MENPPDPRPVFEADQVLTFIDIMGIRNGYAYQHKTLPWYRFKRRYLVKIGVGVCDAMLHWLAHGKPSAGTDCQGEEHGY